MRIMNADSGYIPKCGECGVEVKRLVRVVNKVKFPGSGINLCHACLKKALALLTESVTP